MDKIVSEYFEILKITLDKIDANEIKKVISCLESAIETKKTLYVMGNGGSGATASHFCSDYNKLCYFKNKKSKMVCLNDNMPTLLAFANDVSYDVVFKEQLKNFLSSDDVVIAISGSGNSKNVINAIEYANSIGAITIGFTGFDGGKLKKIAKISLNTNLNDMKISEDIHLALIHSICRVLDRVLK